MKILTRNHLLCLGSIVTTSPNSHPDKVFCLVLLYFTENKQTNKQLSKRNNIQKPAKLPSASLILTTGVLFLHLKGAKLSSSPLYTWSLSPMTP